MKIAISVQGNDLSSPVDPRFGRAPYFIVYDIEQDSFEAISNEENVAAAQGAGVQAAQRVVGQKVDWVISGNIGPKAFTALKAAGVKIASWSDGSAQEAVELVKQGKLKEVAEPNVQGHWM
jgi:predicted Fe-Mo cluster-binding NifX family protein